MDIKELKRKVELEGDQNGGLIALLAKVEEKITSTGKPYLKCSLQDKTGQLELSKWNATEADKEVLKAGAIIQFANLSFSMYNGEVSAKSNNATAFNEIIGDVNDFKLTVTPPIDELMARFKKHADSITDKELRVVLEKIVNPRFKQFKNWPAAEKMHHDSRNGLLYHTVGILDIVDAICTLPNYQDADAQLIKTAAMLHDIGKIEEYCVDDEFNGTLSKYALKGHIVIASELVHDLCREGLISEELELNLSHIILAHHGKREYGSPVIPSTLDAYILHIADILDARTYAFHFNSLELGEGEIANKGTFMLDNARLYVPEWRSKD